MHYYQRSDHMVLLALNFRCISHHPKGHKTCSYDHAHSKKPVCIVIFHPLNCTFHKRIIKGQVDWENLNPGHKAKKQAWFFKKLDSKCQNFETAQLLILPQQTLEKVAHGIMHSFACTNWFHFDLFWYCGKGGKTNCRILLWNRKLASMINLNHHL